MPKMYLYINICAGTIFNTIYQDGWTLMWLPRYTLRSDFWSIDILHFSTESILMRNSRHNRIVPRVSDIKKKKKGDHMGNDLK